MDDIGRVIQELRACPAVDGVTMAGILDLPDQLRPTLKEMVRGRAFSHGEMCTSLDVDTDAGQQVIDLLLEKGYVQVIDAAGEPAYRIALAPIRGHPIGDDL